MPEHELRSKSGARMDWVQLSIAQGHYPHLTEVHKFGSSTSLTTNWSPVAHGSVYQMPTAGTSLEAVSDSTEDSSSGAGARSISVTGLSTDWVEITEVVEMNGTTAVSLDNKFTRVHRAYVETSGNYADMSAGSHVGEITLRSSAGGDEWAHIHDALFARGQTQIGLYTIPKGVNGYVFIHHIAIDSNKTADIMLIRRCGADTVTAPFSAMRMVVEWVGVTGLAPIADFGSPYGPFEGPCDVGFLAKAAATAEVSVDFEIIKVANDA